MNRNYFRVNHSHTLTSNHSHQSRHSRESEDEMVVSSENNIEDCKIQNYDLGKKSNLARLPSRDNESLDANFQETESNNTHTLNLSHLKLQALPADIPDKGLVRELQLNDNELTHLPASLADFSSLQVLNLANNQIVQLPCQLKSLPVTQLYLQNNQLHSIDESITSLPLTHLNLVSNPFTKLPPSFANLLDHLHELSLGWFYLLDHPLTVTNFQHSELKSTLKVRLVYDIPFWVLFDEKQTSLVSIFFKAIQINEKGIVQELIDRYPKLINSIDPKMGSLLFFTYK